MPTYPAERGRCGVHVGLGSKERYRLEGANSHDFDWFSEPHQGHMPFGMGGKGTKVHCGSPLEGVGEVGVPISLAQLIFGFGHFVAKRDGCCRHMEPIDSVPLNGAIERRRDRTTKPWNPSAARPFMGRGITRIWDAWTHIRVRPNAVLALHRFASECRMGILAATS